jgi:5-formyltetrahydrofolate cyclo-ligase
LATGGGIGRGNVDDLPYASRPIRILSNAEVWQIMREEAVEMQSLKDRVRREAEANRRAQPDKDEASRIICGKFAAGTEYAAAETVMCYVDMRSEVRTRQFLATALGGSKRIVVPYCVGDRLGLFLLERMEELALGTFGILEPKEELRAVAEKRVEPEGLDLVMAPGVAFDRRGARLGHGRGYYDRLLDGVRPDTRLVALAFECQMFLEIPTEPHDVYMDKVITEKAVYEGRGTRGEGGGRREL